MIRTEAAWHAIAPRTVPSLGSPSNCEHMFAEWMRRKYLRSSSLHPLIDLPPDLHGKVEIGELSRILYDGGQTVYSSNKVHI